MVHLPYPGRCIHSIEIIGAPFAHHKYGIADSQDDSTKVSKKINNENVPQLIHSGNTNKSVIIMVAEMRIYINALNI